MSLALILGLACAWLVAGIVCVALCVSAARGDRGHVRRAATAGGPARRFTRGLGSAT